MGIKQLMKLLNEEAPGCFKETEKKNYMGRTIAFDASMALYAMLVQIRTSGQGGGPAQQLTNADGEVTSHIQGFFSRTINLLQKGIKPIFVFDGKPPELKINELRKRKSAKEGADEKIKEAAAKIEALDEEGGEEAKEARTEAIAEIDKQAKRSTRVTGEHNADIQKLLTLMGLPVVIAPSEAEAQCAELCKGGKVYGSASEDMDLLTFGTPIMLRKLSLPDSVSEKQPPLEIHLDKVLHLLGLEMDQFIDMCILLGCDYSPSVKGIGPKKGYALIKEHKTLEKVLASLDPKKYDIPEELTSNLDVIRGLFKQPEVTPHANVEITWGKMDEEGLLKYLVEEKGFNEDRVKSSLKRLADSKKVTSQKRLDSFFKPKGGAANGKVSGFKRSAETKKKPKGVKRRR